jgi:DNA replication protein DnaC
MNETEGRAKPQDSFEGVNSHLRLIQTQIESGLLSIESDSDTCPNCYGTGFEVGERGARRCRCRRAAILSQRLAQIPPRYEGVTLNALAARTDLHPKQKISVELMRHNPTDSYAFCGKPDTGKTHLMWALYERASRDLDRRIVACSMLQLINEYREAFKPRADDAPPPEVRIRPNDLMQSHTPYSLFFDDIDKPKLTEYVAEQIHALFDAAYINKHQIVVTTNLSPDRLVEHFERADDRYGAAIVRRIVHGGNNLIEFF